MRGDNRPSAPNYTSAALTMGLVNLLWIFAVIWTVFGFAASVLCALGLNWMIDRIAARRG